MQLQYKKLLFVAEHKAMQSKFYVSGPTKCPKLTRLAGFFFSSFFLIDLVHLTSYSCMKEKDKHTTVLDIESNCILT